MEDQVYFQYSSLSRAFMQLECFKFNSEMQWFHYNDVFSNKKSMIQIRIHIFKWFFWFFWFGNIEIHIFKWFFLFFWFWQPQLKKNRNWLRWITNLRWGSQNQKNQKNHLNMCNSELSNQKNQKNHLNMCIRIGIIDFFIRNAHIFANPLMLHETVLARFCSLLNVCIQKPKLPVQKLKKHYSCWLPCNLCSLNNWNKSIKRTLFISKYTN